MVRQKRYLPAQRGPRGELLFWAPYRKGYVVVNYSQALAEMARKYGRTAVDGAEQARERAEEEETRNSA